MKASAWRRHRYGRVFVPLTLAAVLAVTGFELVTAPRIGAVSPVPGSFSRTASLTVRVRVSDLTHVRGLSVTFDNVNVTDRARVSGDTLTLTVGPLSQGMHAVSVTGVSSNLFGRELHKTWRFTIDTTPPPLAMIAPLRGTIIASSPVVLRGTSEPGALIRATVAPSSTASQTSTGHQSSGTVQSDATGQSDAAGQPDATSQSSAAGQSAATSQSSATSQCRAASDGSFALRLTPPDGRRTIELTATDRAGNATRLALPLVIDLQAPRLNVTSFGDVVTTPTPVLHVSASDAAGPVEVRLRLDDATAPIVRRLARAGKLAIPLPKLTDGTHSLGVTAVDRGGHTVSNQQTFLVDSTEKFGAAILSQGARGADVVVLQRKLRRVGAYRGSLTGVLGPGTLAAVKRFERRLGMTPDGIVGPEVVGALTGRIVVDLSECKLFLYLDGKLVKTYSVAVGQPAYPTPTGDFRIVSMIKDPTWIPPDSPWAKGLEPIPPGPDNPVGTRWIGTSAKGVGIHGTSADYSIGTHASHGCIRMHMWDVEDLFTRVLVGMPIHIQP